MSRSAVLLVGLLALGAAGSPVEAQALLGLTVGASDDLRLTLGGTLAIPIDEPDGPVLLGIGGAAMSADSIESFESWTYWEANVDLIFRSTAERRLRPFLITGLVFAREREECGGFCPQGGPEWMTSFGFNLGGGVALVWESFAPFVGAKAELRQSLPIVFFLGAAVPLPIPGVRGPLD